MDKSQILKEIIESRKSTFPRDYTGEGLAPEVLNAILDSAQFVPNHKRTRPWRFRVFTGAQKDELGATLAGIYRDTTPPAVFLQKKYEDIPAKAGKAGAIISISVAFSGLVPEWEEIAAVAMGVQNMYLTCTATNVGCYWSSPGLIKYLDGYLGLAENEKCYGLFYLGALKSELDEI
ncbi:nitroreductase [Chryseobacterium sp.]|uniref:nitroreductase family protein n=1 Tax=Chryseobacterium sp. TaxID=1871047 RepID=UPI0012A7B4E3|nr:nitroreductase [Chryseobacterium sp.]QFG53783.1 nitroreductase [Chryseobacterium sp.]